MVARGLQKFLPDLAALARFPVAACISFLLCIALNIQIWLDASKDTAEIISAGAVGFLAAGAAHFFAEGRNWARRSSVIVALVAAVVFAAAGYFTSVFSTSLLFLFPALIVTVMIGGYLRHNAEQGAIWLFNLRLGIAALLAGIVAGLCAAGLSAIVEALNFLFDVGLADYWHSHIWATALTLIAPLYGLSLMPQDLDEQVHLTGQHNTLIERGVSVLVNYVLVPIAIVYALILHAYAVKIALQGELPKGQIGTMVTIFALGGTGAWLIAWPWRDTGTWLLRAFMRGWFWLTIVPAALLVIAIWRRIADYGMTPDRYGLVLTAIWLAAVAAYLAVRRNQADMRAILGGIAILLLIGAAGPWGACGLTNASQFARLTALMQANGLLKDGKAVLPPPKMDAKVSQEGYSILYALRETDGLGQLKAWFAEKDRERLFKQDSSDWAQVSDITAALGFANAYVQPNFVSFNGEAPVNFRFADGGLLVGPLRTTTNRSESLERRSTAEIEGTDVVIRINERSWRLPVRQLMEATKVTHSASTSSGSLVVEERNVGTSVNFEGSDGLRPPIVLQVEPKLTLLIVNASGEMGDSPKLNYAMMWAIVKPP